MPFCLLVAIAPTPAGRWLTLVVALLLASACVAIHYEAISFTIRLLDKRRLHHRLALPLAVHILLVAHLAEILLYASAFHLLESFGPAGVGSLTGSYNATFPDAFYFSASVYTTVGFGDITPQGPLRFITGTEALVGLVMVTWSASFSFIAMSRYWQDQHPQDNATDA